MLIEKKPTKATKKTNKNKPLPTFLRPKEIKVVTRKVLEKIADGIHNPKTGHYLNLCVGTLENGPDPVCETRTMHCGLGELYFVVTGRQPEQDKVTEAGVVQEIIKRSTIGEYEIVFQKQVEQAAKKIKAMDLPEDLCDELLNQLNNWYFESEEEQEFRAILDGIPTNNDQGKETTADFQARAKRVAASLREAAKLLPR